MEETNNKETTVMLDQHSAGSVSMHKKKQQQLHEVRDQEEYQTNEAFSEEDEPEQLYHSHDMAMCETYIECP